MVLPARNRLRQIATLRRLAWLALGLLSALPALALDRRLSLDQLHHTRWTISEGAPGDIRALAQTSDGYLWLGSSIGLYRFDGVAFERFEPEDGEPLPSDSISALLALPDNGLLIGSGSQGHTSVLRDGRLSHAGERSGFSNRIRSFARDSDGRIWAATLNGLYRLEGTHWQRADPRQQRVYQVFAGRDGSVWTASVEGIFKLPPRARDDAFERLDLPVSFLGLFAQSPDGTLWQADERLGLRRPEASDRGTWPWRNASAMAIDRDGALWLESDTGLNRIRFPENLPPPAQAVPADLAESMPLSRLSGNGIRAMLEDREGNLWVSTIGGLDRFRNNVFFDVAQPGGGGGLAPADDGQVWLASYYRGLLRSGRAHGYFPEAGAQLTLIHRDHEGILWLGGQRRPSLLHYRQGRFGELPLPEGGEDRWVSALAKDAQGALWVSLYPPNLGGVYRYAGGVWRERGGIAGLPQQAADSLWFDQQQRLWLGYADNRVAMLEAGKVRSFDADDGLAVGDVQLIRSLGANVWFAGESGLARYANERFHSLRTADELGFRGVTGIVATGNGDLWLSQTAGVSHLPAAELAKSAADPRYRVQVRRFDYLDGIQGTPVQVAPRPTATQSDDGKLWFTAGNLFWVDPERILRNPLPPPVIVRALTRNDGVRIASPRSGLELPQGTDNLRIDYTALSLTMPERVRFRYRLHGVDTQWQQAGTRREAFYTNLRPGKYRFHVIASNNDGVWNSEGATLDFSIAPAFHQTGWFLILCALAALGLLWMLYLLRLRRLTARLREQIGERHRERERIARELHDTLLQSVQGLILRFQALSDRLPDDEPVRSAMVRTLDRADEVLAEGRKRVMDLRAGAGGIGELSAALSAVGDELGQTSATVCLVQYEGTPYRLNPLVQDELYRIGREALLNAFQHADARQVTVRVIYGRRALRLSVCDNGHGLPEAVLQARGKPGHWGLSGMQERAGRIGAAFKLDSAVGGGTCIELEVPAGDAYRGRRRRRWLGRGHQQRPGSD
ncbi:sensor histidine kinase [Pseudoxanthomonas wuyuanensis]